MPETDKPSYLKFDKKAYAWQPAIDYRRQPELYRVGKGEQGVLICEPYKSELVVHWRFKTPEAAAKSSETIFWMFEDYLRKGDFVGADLARKFLQMGYTRARRYANYRGGRKYDQDKGYKLLERGKGDPRKAESAQIFYEYWKEAEANPNYRAQKKAWKKEHG
jgi:hypothetical protein